MAPDRNGGIRHVFSVDVEEYYQVEAFSGVISRKDWNRFPSRVEESTGRLLEILSECGVRGTFFVLGCLAEKCPALLNRISAAGHEIASHGYDHTMIHMLTPASFREDVRKSKRILEDAAGIPVKGYRAPTFSITEKTSWAYGILLEEGYAYSSSVFPILHDRYGWVSFGDLPRNMTGDGKEPFWELPLSVEPVGPVKIPFGGGGYLRLYPLALTKALFRRAERLGKRCIVYVHPWELDTEQPAVGAPFFRRLRHGIGIAGMEGKLKELLRSRRFGTFSQQLDALREAGGRP